MKKEWLVKTLTLCVVVLFISTSSIPVICGNIGESRDKEIVKTLNYDKYNKIEVIEFKADGSIEKNVVRLSQEQLNEVINKLEDTNDLEVKLSIYKQYGLISSNVTSERLKEGMMEKLHRMNYSKGEIEEIVNNYKKNKSLLLKNFHLNFLCQVLVEIAGFGSLGAMSFILGRFNWRFLIQYGFAIPSVDFIDAFLGIGKVEIGNGMLSDWSESSLFYYSSIGFVGIVLRYPGFIFYPFIAMDGYAVCAFERDLIR